MLSSKKTIVDNHIKETVRQGGQSVKIKALLVQLYSASKAEYFEDNQATQIDFLNNLHVEALAEVFSDHFIDVLISSSTRSTRPTKPKG